MICYNLYVHGSIATIFGENVAEKVGNQNVHAYHRYCMVVKFGHLILATTTK